MSSYFRNRRRFSEQQDEPEKPPHRFQWRERVNSLMMDDEKRVSPGGERQEERHDGKSRLGSDKPVYSSTTTDGLRSPVRVDKDYVSSVAERRSRFSRTASEGLLKYRARLSRFSNDGRSMSEDDPRDDLMESRPTIRRVGPDNQPDVSSSSFRQLHTANNNSSSSTSSSVQGDSGRDLFTPESREESNNSHGAQSLWGQSPDKELGEESPMETDIPGSPKTSRDLQKRSLSPQDKPMPMSEELDTCEDENMGAGGGMASVTARNSEPWIQVRDDISMDLVATGAIPKRTSQAPCSPEHEGLLSLATHGASGMSEEPSGQHDGARDAAIPLGAGTTAVPSGAPGAMFFRNFDEPLPNDVAQAVPYHTLEPQNIQTSQETTLYDLSSPENVPLLPDTPSHENEDQKDLSSSGDGSENVSLVPNTPSRENEDEKDVSSFGDGAENVSLVPNTQSRENEDEKESAAVDGSVEETILNAELSEYDKDLEKIIQHLFGDTRDESEMASKCLSDEDIEYLRMRASMCERDIFPDRSNSPNGSSSENGHGNGNKSGKSDSLAWARLPFVLLEDIYTFLTPKERHNASQVCRQWYDLFYSPRVWETFILMERTLTKKRFNMYKGYQREICPGKTQLCFRRVGSFFKRIIVTPIRDYFNLYEFFRILAAFLQRKEEHGELGMPLLHTFELTFACASRGDGEMLVHGTGGQILTMIEDLLVRMRNLKHLKLNQLMIDVVDIQGLFAAVSSCFGESLNTLEIVNLTKVPVALDSLAEFRNLIKLTVSPQHISEEVLVLLAGLSLLQLHLLQDRFTCECPPVHYEAWKLLKEMAPWMKVYLELCGDTKDPLLIQPRAPVYGIFLRTPYSRLDNDLAMSVVEHYSATLTYFVQERLPRVHGPRGFNGRCDSPLLFMVRRCPALRTLAIRERISTCTLLLVASESPGLSSLLVRQHALIKRCDWPRCGEWSREFYSRIHKASMDYDKCTEEVCTFLQRRWKPLTDKQFMRLKMAPRMDFF